MRSTAMVRRLAAHLAALFGAALILALLALFVTGPPATGAAIAFAAARVDDVTPPVTVARPAKVWRHRAVTVTLTATDDLSGVASTFYKVGDGAWQTGVSLVVPAPADHDNDGLHVVSFYSTDVAGNVEAVKTARIGIDTRRPSTRALYAVSVARGKTARIDYRVNDRRPNGRRAYVTILVKKMNGSVARRIVAGWVSVNSDHAVKFPATLKKMIYRYHVKARDAAGNRQRSTGSHLFLVW